MNKQQVGNVLVEAYFKNYNFTFTCLIDFYVGNLDG